MESEIPRSSLEKEIQELRAANEQMISIFISLYDFAAKRDVLQQEPEFCNELGVT